MFLKEDKKRKDQHNEYNISYKKQCKCAYFRLTERAFYNFDFSVISLNMDIIEDNDFLMVKIARIFTKTKPVKWYYICLIELHLSNIFHELHKSYF